MTKLGAAIREDINTNMIYIVNLPALTIIFDDISKTCHELQRENSRFSAQSTELHKKLAHWSNG